MQNFNEETKTSAGRVNEEGNKWNPGSKHRQSSKQNQREMFRWIAKEISLHQIEGGER